MLASDTKSILIIPDSFKNCLTALEVSQAITEGIKKNQSIENYVITSLPLSDGGEGSLEVIKENYQAKTTRLAVTHPLLEEEGESIKKISSEVAFNQEKKLAIIESAKLCGLELIPPPKRNPFHTTTYPLGEAIEHYKNYASVIITLGGSATNDAGLGMLQALGAEVVLDDDQIANEPVKLVDFFKIKKINLTNAINKTSKINLIVLADVENQLLGEKGCSLVFGPQKFFNPEKINFLDLENRLKHLVKIIHESHQEFEKVHLMNKTGAAGGLGYALALLKANFYSGFNYLAKMHQLEKKIASSQIIFTGEGCFDEQSYMGKIVGRIMELVRQNQPPQDSLKKLFILAGKVKKTIAGNPFITLLETNGQTNEKTNENASSKREKIATILDPKTNYKSIVAKVSKINFNA